MDATRPKQQEGQRKQGWRDDCTGILQLLISPVQVIQYGQRQETAEAAT